LNQLADALACFRRALDIGCRYFADSGNKHIFHGKLVKRYHDILVSTGRTESETLDELNIVGRKYGISFDAEEWK
jgi:hypothetical protein